MAGDYPNDRQTTNLVEMVAALAKAIDGEAVVVAHLMALYVERDVNLRLAYDALIQAAGRLAEASQQMRQAQQERAAERKRAEAEQAADGCEHRLVLLSYPDRRLVVTCDHCTKRIEWQQDDLFARGDEGAAEFRLRIHETFGVALL